MPHNKRIFERSMDEFVLSWRQQRVADAQRYAAQRSCGDGGLSASDAESCC